jgi:hypothetical protein
MKIETKKPPEKVVFYSMSVVGIEPTTNGLKGHRREMNLSKEVEK